MHVGRPSAALVGRVPVAYYVFDLLGTDGASVTAAPYRQRREVLDGLSLEGGSSRRRWCGCRRTTPASTAPSC